MLAGLTEKENDVNAITGRYRSVLEVKEELNTVKKHWIDKVNIDLRQEMPRRTIILNGYVFNLSCEEYTAVHSFHIMIMERWKRLERSMAGLSCTFTYGAFGCPQDDCKQLWRCEN